MSEPAILSSESPDADVLVYDKDVAYYRGNLEVSDAGEDFEVDIPEEYTHLFPLLVTSCLWLEEDEAKSKYYKALYDECIKRIDSSGYEEIDYNYIDTNGWC